MVHEFTAASKPESEQRRSWQAKVRRSLFWFAVALLLAALVVQILQLDSLAALTAIPPWCYGIGGLGMALFGLGAVSRRERIAGAVIALLFVATIEQSWSLGRSLLDVVLPARIAETNGRLRIVSINCNVGRRSAADEVVQFRPDVVFLQESPDEETVRQLAQSLFAGEASFVWSPDCSIVARGKLQVASVQATNSLRATVTSEDGRTLELVCVRLSPPVVCYDLWSPGCWREHAGVRRKHRTEAETILQSLSDVPSDRPIIVGGDLNAPAGDGALRVWSPRLTDTFASAGRGWGCTVLNDLPVHRFDQIWHSRQIEPIAVWAVKSKHSDHRLVVCDLQGTH